MKTDQKPTHTPTPWHSQHVENSGLYEIHSLEFGEHIADCSYSFDGKPKMEWQAQAANNAAFIVRAVNAHEELLNALKQVQIIIDAQGGMDRLGIAIAKVIAKAEGGSK